VNVSSVGMTADCLSTERRLELVPTYLGTRLVHAAVTPEHYHPDFSVVLLRPNFMLVSEGHRMKVYKNQWFLYPLTPLDIPWGATNLDIPHGA
jgi:hypothetical protein